MVGINRFTALGGMMAALSMAVSPASAAELPNAAPIVASGIATPGVFDEDSLKADRHRYWRYRGRHHHHGIDAGDVLAGVLIIGGIAAIANAASNSERDRRYRERDVRYRDDYRYDRRTPRRTNSGRGIDSAVDMCLAEIERDVRVDSVDSVDRTGEGWRVTGTIFNGDRFTCRIGEDGRIDNVDFGGGLASAAPVEDRQHSDERYRAAWAQVERSEPATEARADQLPAYPGGPIDGDIEGTAVDDRYAMAPGG